MADSVAAAHRDTLAPAERDRFARGRTASLASARTSTCAARHRNHPTAAARMVGTGTAFATPDLLGEEETVRPRTSVHDLEDSEMAACRCSSHRAVGV